MTETAKNIHIPNWIRRSIFLWWATGAGIWITYQIATSLRGLLVQTLLALFLSFAMYPMVEILNKKGLKRGVATAITMFSILLFFGIFFTVMGSLIVSQLQDLVKDLPTYEASIRTWANNTFDIEIDNDLLVKEFQSSATGYVDDIASNVFGASSKLLAILFQILTVSLFAFYFTADGPQLRKTICSVLPHNRQLEVLRVWELAIEKTGAYISSRVILAIVSTLFHWLMFTVLGLPSALALALWVGIISQFVPIIGTYIAGVLPVLIALAENPTIALVVIGIILLYQQIENYLLQPRITAQSLNMHPALAFGGVIAGSSLLGATGAVLALPIVATVQSVISAYVERHSLVETDFLKGQEEFLISEEIEIEDKT